MGERPMPEQRFQEATNASEMERFWAICREEADLDPVQLEEVRRQRCLDHFRDRVRAISRLGVEARRRKAAERKAALAAAATASSPVEATD